MAKPRQDVSPDDCWNVQACFSSLEAWKEAFDRFEEKSQQEVWPALQSFRGTLNQGSTQVKNIFEIVNQFSRELSFLYTYAHLRHDEDISEENAKAAFKQAQSLFHEFYQRISWIDPELIELPEVTQQVYLNAPELAEYRFSLEQIFRLKEHTLSADKEEICALAAKPLQASHKAFSAINDADFHFGEITDEQGKTYPLTHGTYMIYLRSQDRILRRNSFLSLHGKFRDYANTLTELLNGTIQAHLFQARAHHYTSCLEAALYPKNIDPSVYHSLIAAVRNNLDGMHKYVDLRTRLLNVGPLHLYDMYVPLCKDMDLTISYQKAEELVIESVAPLGKEYQDILRKGFKEERWVDRYENKSKRSGAYSSGCYDSYPYILMNYKNILRDVFTLAHEAGHSMHSFLSHKHQPYHYGDYSIFVAEVASTFNEQLLTQLLLEHFSDKQQKIYLLNEKIEDIRGTLFRQTMFAEFELFIHESAEANIPLTPAFLCEKYKELNKAYFGPTVILDKEAEYEWARIPHFYYNFYVYQYATGISAALALYQRVREGGDKEREEYLGFLKAGSSAYPVDVLHRAGVDMRQPHAVRSAIEHFKELVHQLSQLL